MARITKNRFAEQIEPTARIDDPRPASPPPPGDTEMLWLDSLAALSKLEYEGQRKKVAKEKGWRTAILDQEVTQRRKATNGRNRTSDLVEELIPWPDAVDIAELLQEIREMLNRYVIFPEGADVAIALWIAGTYVHRFLYIFPRLSITSPEKRCGKTRLVSCLIGLVFRALAASNVSSAVVYRVIEKCAPTLLIDEADTFVPGNNELRGLVNSGHTKPLAFVLRAEGDDHEPARFSTWAPVALASIKSVGDTIIDRSVTIQLRRKMPGESVERLPLKFPQLSSDLRRKLTRWGDDYGESIAEHEPALPESRNDRALDNWRPLLSIAEMAGGDWPSHAMHAFRALSLEDNEAIGPEILSGIRSIFKQDNLEWISSTELADKLNDLEEAPWAHWNSGKGINPINLAKQLKPFGITSQNIRDRENVCKGYRIEAFTDAFDRYLPPLPPK